MSKGQSSASGGGGGADKSQALQRAVGQIEKAFGRGSIMRLNDDPSAVPPGIATGAISLDLALGGRGIPRGRVVEVFGPEAAINSFSRPSKTILYHFHNLGVHKCHHGVNDI